MSSPILSVTEGCKEITQILMVSFMRGRREVLDVDVVVRAAFDIVVCGLQESWEIVFPMFLTMPGQTTIETAAVLAMIAYKTSYMHHTGSVCSEQCEENFRLKFALESAIPDSQTLLLQRSQVLQPQQEK